MNGFGGVSVVIPTVDEKNSIKAVMDKLISLCADDISEFIIIYSKNSSADYVEYLVSLKSVFPDKRIIVRKQTRPGFNAAMYEGYHIACATHVAAIAADLETPPEALAEMIALAKVRPGEIITGSRTIAESGFRNYPKIKLFFNRLFAFILKTVFKTKQTDVTFLFQCTPAELLKKYDFSDNVENFVLSLALLPELYGIPFTEVPVVLAQRSGGRTHAGAKYYFDYFTGTLKIFIKKPKEVRR